MNKNYTLGIYILTFWGVILMLTNNCKKDIKSGQVPILTTTEIISFAFNVAKSGGNITNDGGELITTCGVCWNTSQNPTIDDNKTATNKAYTGSNTGLFESTLSGLGANTTYYVRAYATNSSGTGYGNSLSITTSGGNSITFNPKLTYGSVVDFDGNIYKTISIGTQTWMAENLKTTRYRDGSLIGTTNPHTYDVNVEDNPKYQWAYDGIEENIDIYGRLYTWYAVTDSRSICPIGWHVPSDEEWTILTNYLIINGYGSVGGSSIAIAKSLAAKSGWDPTATYDGSPGGNQANNNNSGFTALPGSSRTNSNIFDHIGYYAIWWTSTKCGTIDAWMRSMASNSGIVEFGGTAAVSGFSVRCIKDK